jgi:type IV pilus assembly protein PilB
MALATLSTSIRSKLTSKQLLDLLLKTLTSRKPLTEDDADTVLGTTIRKVADTIFAQAVTIFLVDRAANRIRFQNVYYSPSLYGLDEQKRKLFEAKAEELQTKTLPLGQGIVGQVIASGKTEFLADAQRDSRYYSRIEKETGFVTRSMICVPLRLGEEVIGAIQVMNKAREARQVTQFSPEDVTLLEDVATYSAKVIKRVRDPNTRISEREMAGYVARLANCEFLEIEKHTEIDVPLIKLLGEENLKRYCILPLRKLNDKALRAAVANPLDFQTIGDFELVSGLKVAEKVVAAAGDIQQALLRVWPEQDGVGEMAEKVKEEYSEAGAEAAAGAGGEEENENSAPIVKLSNRIIEDAFDKGASDIHIEPQEMRTRVRYRVDGVCKEQMEIPRSAHRALVSRFKIMSELNISERRVPQDGRIQYKKFNPRFDLDLRVSTAPMNHGEKICMRILDKTKSCLPLDKLGFSDYNLKLYRDLIQAPYGMILHCGPTGSGKSMTLFAALNEINSPDWNISTAEDPIEYTLAGINQMQMKKEVGLTFASALRCFLRQDPDIILVGEIRDLETAEIAIEAALTGHVLFSTLHTNDAPSTVTRFEEMGVEPFMVATCLVAICAQRLGRRLCACKQPDDPRPEELQYLERALDERPIGRILRPAGCEKCGKSGYKGRFGTHELLRNTDELRTQICQRVTAEKIKEAARAAGMRTLFEDLMEKVKSGLTSMQEALGTARPDDSPSPMRRQAALT